MTDKHARVPRSIALCADDYGQHAGIDDAICCMLAAGHLSAISCLSTAPRWHEVAAPALRTTLAHVAQLQSQQPSAAADKEVTAIELATRHAGLPDIGLHFNLTAGFGQPAPTLSTIVLRSYLRQLDRSKLVAMLERQFDAFETAMGRQADFIDGHQHVHQLPVVRDTLLTVLERRYDGARRPWLRNTVAANPVWRGKPRWLERFGGSALRQQLDERALPTNCGFAGVYGFDNVDYLTQFGSWLDSAEDGMLIMCHPGASPDPADPISAARLREYAFFRSEQFPAMLGAYHIRLDRLSAILPRIEAALAQLPPELRDKRYLPSKNPVPLRQRPGPLRPRTDWRSAD